VYLPLVVSAHLVVGKRFNIPEFLLGALTVIAVLAIFLAVVSRGGQVELPHAKHDAGGRQPVAVPSAPAGSADSPVFVRIQKTEDEIAHERAEQALKASTDGSLALFTAFLFLATLGLMIATGGLWYYAIKQSRDMAESLKIAAEAAGAAKLSADVANRSFTQLERPYVFVADIGGLLVPDGLGERVHVPFSILNLGRTPGFVSDLFAELFVLSNPIPRVVANLPFSNAVHKMGDVLPGGGRIDDIVCYMRADADQLDEIRRRAKYVILKVAVLYSDSVGHKHHSNLHWLYDPDRDYFSTYVAEGCNTYD